MYFYRSNRYHCYASLEPSVFLKNFPTFVPTSPTTEATIPCTWSNDPSGAGPYVPQPRCAVHYVCLHVLYQNIDIDNNNNNNNQNNDNHIVPNHNHNPCLQFMTRMIRIITIVFLMIFFLMQRI
jgi:hypothetical protein